MLKVIHRALLTLLVALPLLAQAAPAQSPYDVVKQATDSLLADLKANKEHYRNNPGDFYESLNRILGPVADVDGISRSIMTVRYSRNATPEQMARFQENFKRSLMQFYGNALLQYNGQSIRVLPGSSGSADEERDSVNMEITDTNGTVYPMSYTMVNKDNHWLVRNVVINGINIGKLFRDQFAQAMRENNNDLDKTIAAWPDYVARARQSAQGQKAGA